MRLLPLLVLVALVPTRAFSTEAPSAAQAVNKAVEALEKRIKDGDKRLPTLTVQYDFHDATEGVPPDFKFFYEPKESGPPKLRIAKTHVGHEVFATDFAYYFDEEGRPMKYLATSTGVAGDGGFPASRSGIIYAPSGKTIWSSGKLELPVTFKELTELFTRLDRDLGKF